MNSTEKINLALILNNFDVGGLEKVVLDLANNLNQDIFRIHVICIDGEGKLFQKLSTKKIRTLVLKKKPGIDISIIRKLMMYFRENRITLIHAHNIAPLVYGGIAAKLLHPNIPVIYSEHNQVYRLTKWGRAKFKFYLRYSDHIVTVSKRLREFYRTDLGISRDINVLYNGINPEIYKFTKSSDLRAQIGVADDDFVVGTAVVLSKQKGIPYLLEAAKSLANEHPDIKIVIAGDGPDHLKLEELCRTSGVSGTVRFLGYRDDIPKLLSSFDVYILPSLWEGLPLALIESLAVGIPAIATDVGGNSEIIEHGINGLIVPANSAKALADAITQMYNQRESLSHFRELNIAKFNSTFSLASMISSHERFYLGAVGQ